MPERSCRRWPATEVPWSGVIASREAVQQGGKMWGVMLNTTPSLSAPPDAVTVDLLLPSGAPITGALPSVQFGWAKTTNVTVPLGVIKNDAAVVLPDHLSFHRVPVAHGIYRGSAPLLNSKLTSVVKVCADAPTADRDKTRRI